MADLKPVKSKKDIRLKHITMICNVLEVMELEHMIFDIVDKCKDLGLEFDGDKCIE
jgi:hypothetical protein